MEIKKQKITRINAPKSCKYLREISSFKKIPSNVLFNKGDTGCGGTRLEIETHRHSIIAVPNKYTIISKCKQHSMLQGVYSGVGRDEIIAYLTVDTIHDKKIMVTYDSIPRVIEAIQSTSMSMSSPKLDVYNDFFLLIDEYHVLFNHYHFRYDAISTVLEVFQKFRKFCFMSGTPLEEEFILEELKHLPVVEIEWEGKTKVTVIPIETQRPSSYAAKRIKEAVSKTKFGNLHIFVNSVTFIAKILSACDLHCSLVRIVCANTPNNQNKIGNSHKITDASSELKLINFYTSTAFEGVDIEDKDGKTIIISDGSAKHTLLDISTLIPQICGRIRDSRYNDTVMHIFSKNFRYRDRNMSLEQFNKHTREQEAKELSFINSLNSIPNEEDRKRMIGLIKQNNINNPYLRIAEDGSVRFDVNLVKVDRLNFKILNKVYGNATSLVTAYKENGFNVTPVIIGDISDALLINSKAKKAFKACFLEYAALREDDSASFGNGIDRIHFLELERPLLKQAYEKLGTKEVKRMNYRVSNIKAKLLTFITKDENELVFKLISNKLPLNRPILTEKALATLQNVYDSIEINRRAKLTHFERWFEVQKSTALFASENGKTITLKGTFIMN